LKNRVIAPDFITEIMLYIHKTIILLCGTYCKCIFVSFTAEPDKNTVCNCV